MGPGIGVSSPSSPGVGVGGGESPAASAPEEPSGPTRFYFPRTGAVVVSPAFDAVWTDDAGSVRRPTSTVKSGTLTLALVGGNGTVGVANVLLAQYVSAPLAAQTISGTIKGQFVCGEYDPAVNARAQMVVRVLSGDGTVVRGTLVSAHSEALSSEWGPDTAPRSRKFPLAALSPVTLNSVDAQAGDRLVFELGARVDDNGAEQVELIVGDAQGALDLPEDETSSTVAGDGWVELSATLAWEGA